MNRQTRDCGHQDHTNKIAEIFCYSSTRVLVRIMVMYVLASTRTRDAYVRDPRMLRPMLFQTRAGAWLYKARRGGWTWRIVDASATPISLSALGHPNPH